MNDSGPGLIARPGKIPVSGEQCVYQRTLVISPGRVDDHTLGFVDDHDVTVLVNHLNGKILGEYLKSIGDFEPGDYFVAAFYLIAGLGRFLVDENLPLLDEFFRLTSGNADPAPNQVGIEPGPGHLFRHDSFKIFLHLSSSLAFTKAGFPSESL